jgi:Fur family transcriptional regulator, peroxide stress response regulator
MCRDDATLQTSHLDAHWRAAVASALKLAQIRHSPVREALLDWIAASSGPFTAETIVQQLVDGWGIGSRPTVYRAMEWLRAAGWVARLHGEGVDRTYARCVPGGHQLVCTGCGAIRIITNLELTPLLQTHLRTLGFELSGQHLELYGRCQLCRELPAAVGAPPIEQEPYP